MKKMVPGGLAAIVVLALIACDGVGPDVQDVVEYTADGRRLVNLTIDTGGEGRAMTGPMAQAAVNYYEVIFHDGTDYYRVAGYKGQSLSLRVPEGTYDNVNGGKALVFAGHDPGNGEKTLLAIGKLTGADIIATTTSVTFQLTALEGDASVGGSFAVTAGDTADGTVTYLGESGVPFFGVASDSAITATYTIGGLDTDADPANGAPGVTFGDFVFINGTGLLTSWGLVPSAGPSGAVVLSAESVTPASDEIGAAGEIGLGFTTSAHDGWVFINFDVPVSAFATDVPNGSIWHIRGGLQNQLVDTADNPLGGGIILGVGSVSSGVTISIIN